LVCDESALFRRQMVIALEADPRIEVVAEAPDSDAARGGALQHAPDVAFVSADLPPLGGDRTTLAVRETNPGVMVILVYEGDEADRSGRVLARALRAGAHALVPRRVAVEVAAATVQSLARGRPVLEPVLARSVLAEYADRRTPTLTARERTVLEQIAGGATTDAAAAAIGASVHTAENLVANALAKLQRGARAEGRARLRGTRATGT
jgi:DNA-binding NarL/FixJ family response regulator